MMLAIKWAREQKVPFLGICLGFQVAVIEWARNVCGLREANSTEFDPTPFPEPTTAGLTAAEPTPKSTTGSNTPHPVIIYMPEISRTHMGGTMRLGLRPTVFQPGSEWSMTRKLYGAREKIWERHRHRYEVNPAYVETLEKSGLLFIGRDEKGERMQVLELKGKVLFSSISTELTVTSEHPFFIALQAHPEFCTRPLNPSPCFLGFVASASAADGSLLNEQIQRQLESFDPPHPEQAMVSESKLRGEDAIPHGVHDGRLNGFAS
jgi:CTP synthase